MFFDVTEWKIRAKVGAREDGGWCKMQSTGLNLTRNMVGAYLKGHSNKTLLFQAKISREENGEHAKPEIKFP